MRHYINRSLTLIQGVPSAPGLGWVELDLECSIVCPIQPGLVGIWQKWLGSWTRWWSTQIKVNPTQVHEQMRHPVYILTEFSGVRPCDHWRPNDDDYGVLRKGGPQKLCTRKWKGYDRRPTDLHL